MGTPDAEEPAPHENGNDIGDASDLHAGETSKPDPEADPEADPDETSL